MRVLQRSTERPLIGCRWCTNRTEHSRRRDYLGDRVIPKAGLLATYLVGASYTLGLRRSVERINHDHLTVLSLTRYFQTTVQ